MSQALIRKKQFTAETQRAQRQNIFHRKGAKDARKTLLLKKRPSEFVCASMDPVHKIALRADKICNRLASFYTCSVLASLAPLR